MHQFPIRVYYEDTDLGGIVYYANYLKFIERGRSEWLRDLGIDQVALKAEQGLIFVVRRVEADYQRPAHFDDLLTVETECIEMGGASLSLNQSVLRGGQVLFAGKVVLVCLNAQGRATRLPNALRAKMAASH